MFKYWCLLNQCVISWHSYILLLQVWSKGTEAKFTYHINVMCKDVATLKVLWCATIFLDMLIAHTIASISCGQHMKSEFCLWLCNDTQEEGMFYNMLKVERWLGRKWLSIISWYKKNRTVRCSIQWRTKNKSKLVPVDIMKVYRESRDVVLLFVMSVLEEGEGRTWCCRHLIPGKESWSPLPLPGFKPWIFQHVV